MSSSPMRIQAGFTQDASWQPLGLIGAPDPTFYATFFDDFMGYQAGRFTNTNTGNGSEAPANGVGGRVLFTTNTSTPAAGDIASIQVDSACVQYSAAKKLAFLTRLQLADVTNSAMLAGVIQKTTTPFTVTDGIYFSKATGTTNLTVNVMASSVVIATTTLTGLLTNATDVDLGFTYDGRGSLLIFAGAGLLGQKPNQNTATLGPVARLTPASFPTALLTPTLSLQSGTATSKTMNADLLYASVER